MRDVGLETASLTHALRALPLDAIEYDLPKSNSHEAGLGTVGLSWERMSQRMVARLFFCLK